MKIYRSIVTGILTFLLMFVPYAVFADAFQDGLAPQDGVLYTDGFGAFPFAIYLYWDDVGIISADAQLYTNSDCTGDTQPSPSIVSNFVTNEANAFFYITFAENDLIYSSVQVTLDDGLLGPYVYCVNDFVPIVVTALPEAGGTTTVSTTTVINSPADDFFHAFIIFMSSMALMLYIWKKR